VWTKSALLTQTREGNRISKRLPPRVLRLSIIGTARSVLSDL
jgi:hypothetical protein